MNNIKRKFVTMTLIIGVIVVLLLQSCDKGFEELNKNPNAFISPDLGNMFTYSLIVAAGGPGYTNNPLYFNCKLTGAFMQYFASLNPYQWTGDKYLKKPSYDDALFSGVYGTELKEVVQTLSLTKDKPDLINQYAISRIL